MLEVNFFAEDKSETSKFRVGKWPQVNGRLKNYTCHRCYSSGLLTLRLVENRVAGRLGKVRQCHHQKQSNSPHSELSSVIPCVDWLVIHPAAAGRG